MMERDQYDMEPLGAFFSSPGRDVSEGSRNGNPEDDGNEQAGAEIADEEILSVPLLLREDNASMVHLVEHSPLQLQPILPALMESAMVYLSCMPAQNGAAQIGPRGYDTEPCANIGRFPPEMSGNEVVEEDDNEWQVSQHGDTNADALQHLEEAFPVESRNPCQQPEDVESEWLTSPCTIRNNDEGTTETLLQQASTGNTPRRKRGRPQGAAPGQSKGLGAGSNSHQQQFQVLSSASPELSGDVLESEEAECARERKRPRKTAAQTAKMPYSTQTEAGSAQEPRPKGQPLGRPRRRTKRSSRCVGRRKAKTVMRPEGHAYTTRSGRVSHTPIHDWRGDEEELGTISVNCKVWQTDRETDQPGVGGSLYVNRQVAFTSEEILNRYPAKPNFHFGKINTATSMSFGILHLPSGQTKEARNTRGAEQACFLHSGKVSVELEQQPFRISEGSSWIVPRGMFAPILSSAGTVMLSNRGDTGNYYSITNDYHDDAYIFFCINSET
ncbi:hypothetical protein FALBO_10528 [Fusarium albosuccineum]|uniref:Mif2/CENP-C cupin domain-containing protein n=1 Tax=Fusarium albosuccineum TaxID=1237068 RepID=A0A8H4L6U9_9HYPO|nr:hypothetical protein FALBO_10528 [Fusarium albosuccineum]